MTVIHLSLISYADWSKNPDKRWMAIAVWQASCRWLICEPAKASDHPVCFYI
jgi:hypothetical protein